MLIVFSIIALIALFYLLGASADLVITNVRNVGKKLSVPVFALGLLLGVLTSLPEFGIELSSFVQGTPSISVGNLLGGTLVLFGVVLSVGIILNREIKTDGKSETLWPMFAYLLLPLLFALRGVLDVWAGLGLLLPFPVVMYYLYVTHHRKKKNSPNHVTSGSIITDISLMIFGIFGVILLSNAIVTLTLPMLQAFRVPGFLVGLIAYALGTNLPELIVTIRAWRKRVRELSFSNILGSAATNVAILGGFSLARDLPVKMDLSFVILIAATLAIFGLMLHFYHTGKKLTRNEGVALLITYALFVLMELPMFTRLIEK